MLQIDLEWYWKLGPYILYGVGKTIIKLLFLEIIVAQSTDKMKGLVMGIALAFRGIVTLITVKDSQFTLCYDLTIIISSCCTVCGLPGPFQALHTA